MQTNSGNTTSIQELISSSVNQLTTNSIRLFQPLMDTMLSNMTILNPLIKKNDQCCIPEQKCPPHCIASISRTAAEGERIRIPFVIKNNCTNTKTYQIGIREMKDQEGNTAPAQPTLNKNSITLDPGRSETILVMTDLEKFKTGSAYFTEIVLREKEINQNICLTISISNDPNPVVATPLEENKYQQRWQSWQSHFYCEPKKDFNRQ